MSIPTLDFSEFLHGTPEDRKIFGEDIVASFEAHGFVKLINHGIPEQVVKHYQDATKRLFDMPMHDKRQIQNVRGPHPQRGWSSVGEEHTGRLWEGNTQGREDEDLLDEREFFDAGPPRDKMYPNKVPTDEQCPRFRYIMEKCYAYLQEASLKIVEATEVGLELPPKTLVNRCIPASSEIRLNHYPPISVDQLNSNVKRTWPHTDLGIITLLFQDNVGGLEIQDRQNPTQWIPVTLEQPGGKTVLVVNISDTFERWTNGRISAGRHQVNVPPAMKGLQKGVCPDRYSSVFFLKADRDTSAGPLPVFVTKENPARYDEITALQYQQRMTQKLI